MNNKRGRGGFTLVELIVVLVILAILAALLIPALTGYIDKSKKRQVIAETRMLHQAIQTVVSENYGSSQWGNWHTVTGTSLKSLACNRTGSTEEQLKQYQAILSLAEVPSLSGTNPSGSFGAYFTEDAKTAIIVYDDGNGKVGIYFGGTGETIAYDKSDFNSFDQYFSGIRSSVSYTGKYWHGSTLNPLIDKDCVLGSAGLGYKNA